MTLNLCNTHLLCRHLFYFLKVITSHSFSLMPLVSSPTTASQTYTWKIFIKFFCSGFKKGRKNFSNVYNLTPLIKTASPAVFSLIYEKKKWGVCLFQAFQVESFRSVNADINKRQH